MSDSFSSCPQCNSTVLPDTAQCPDCGHVFDESRVALLPGETERAVANKPHGDQEPCPTCGELVRIGMVRCWNCGSFIRDDIARTYEQMQSNQSAVIYSVPPTGAVPPEPRHAASSESAVSERLKDVTVQSSATSPDADPSADSDMDFELGAGLDFETVSDDDFEISADFSLLDAPVESAPASPAGLNSPFEETGPSETYSLSSSRDESTGEPDVAAIEQPAAPSLPLAKSSEKPAPAIEDDKPPEAGTKAAGPAATRRAPSATDDDGPAHSVATAGDVLLQAALEEEAESTTRKPARPAAAAKKKQTAPEKKQTAPDGFVVFCPQGHRIEVQDKHRGKTGKCPKCKSPFVVPGKPAAKTPPPSQEQPESVPASAEPDPGPSAGAYSRWLKDVALHVVNPQKLKLKPGSLQKESTPVDLGFSEEGLLLATLVKPGGLFGSNEKKKEATREALLTALRDDMPLSDLPGAARQLFAKDQLQQIKVEQPAAYEYESIFHGIAVFGEGRIAIRLPKSADVEFPQFLSFWLSEFRRFSQYLSELCGIEALGGESGVPLKDEHVRAKCHYSDETLEFLESSALQQADPSIELKLVGRKCAECGLIVSEDSRKKEKIGGANGKTIAKAKCPKCEKKFGDIALFAVAAEK